MWCSVWYNGRPSRAAMAVTAIKKTRSKTTIQTTTWQSTPQEESNINRYLKASCIFFQSKTYKQKLSFSTQCNFITNMMSMFLVRYKLFRSIQRTFLRKIVLIQSFFNNSLFLKKIILLVIDACKKEISNFFRFLVVPIWIYIHEVYKYML